MKIRVKCYEARTRHLWCRTRIRRGETRRRAGDATARTSRRVVPRGFLVIFADSRRRGFNSGRFARNRADSGLNRPKSTETADSGRNSKKKKKVQNAPFDLFLNPTSTQFHTNAKT